MADDERTRSNRNYLQQLVSAARIKLRKSPYASKPATVNRVAEGLKAQQAVGLPLNVQAARGHTRKERGKELKREVKPEAYESAKKAAKVEGVRIDSRGNITIPLDPKNAEAIRQLIADLAKNQPNLHVFLKTPDGQQTLYKHGGIRAKELDALIAEVEAETEAEAENDAMSHNGEEFEDDGGYDEEFEEEFRGEDEEDEDAQSEGGLGLMTFADREAEKQLGESPKKKKKPRSREAEREHSKRKRERARSKKRAGA